MCGHIIIMMCSHTFSRRIEKQLRKPKTYKKQIRIKRRHTHTSTGGGGHCSSPIGHTPDLTRFLVYIFIAVHVMYSRKCPVYEVGKWVLHAKDLMRGLSSENTIRFGHMFSNWGFRSPITCTIGEMGSWMPSKFMQITMITIESWLCTY